MKGAIPIRPDEPPLILKESTAPKLQMKPSTMPRLDPAEIAQALGAKPTTAVVGGPMGPLSLFAVRQELFRRLTSTGGRPVLLDTEKVAKIPVSETQWKQMEELATTLAAPGFSPSVGQVANVLLSWALDRVKEVMTPEAIRKLAEQPPAAKA